MNADAPRWVSQALLDRDFSGSLHLLDPEGTLVAKHDAMPVDNTLPTTSWRPDEDVLDPTSRSLPARLTPDNGADGDHAGAATVVTQ